MLRKSALCYARALALQDSLLNTLHRIICTAQPTHHTHDLRISRTYNRTIYINQYVRKYEHGRERTYKDKREKLAKQKAWHATAGLIYMRRKKEREKNTYAQKLIYAGLSFMVSTMKLTKWKMNLYGTGNYQLFFHLHVPLAAAVHILLDNTKKQVTV